MSGLLPIVVCWEGRANRRNGPCPPTDLTPPGGLVKAQSVRDEGRTVALLGTALVMNRPRDIVIRRVPSHVLIEVVDGSETES